MRRKKTSFIRLKQEKLCIKGLEELEAKPISSPYDLKDLMIPFFKDLDREMMLVLGLDTKNKPTVISVISIGTLNQATVSTREIFKTLLLANSIRFIIIHNHPSGDTTPSENDLKFTRKIKEVGELMEVYTSTIGKIYAVCFAACGAMFNILAGRLRERNRYSEQEVELHE